MTLDAIPPTAELATVIEISDRIDGAVRNGKPWADIALSVLTEEDVRFLLRVAVEAVTVEAASRDRDPDTLLPNAAALDRTFRALRVALLRLPPDAALPGERGPLPGEHVLIRKAQIAICSCGERMPAELYLQHAARGNQRAPHSFDRTKAGTPVCTVCLQPNAPGISPFCPGEAIKEVVR